MSEGELHQSSEHSAPPTRDVIVCLLGAVAAAFVAWAAVYGLFAGLFYGLTNFNIVLPELAVSALNAIAGVAPLLAALIAAAIGYRFLIKLP
jgi:hypothetical protein